MNEDDTTKILFIEIRNDGAVLNFRSRNCSIPELTLIRKFFFAHYFMLKRCLRHVDVLVTKFKDINIVFGYCPFDTVAYFYLSLKEKGTIEYIIKKSKCRSRNIPFQKKFILTFSKIKFHSILPGISANLNGILTELSYYHPHHFQIYHFAPNTIFFHQFVFNTI
jgi:hypothetical protein